MPKRMKEDTPTVDQSTHPDGDPQASPQHPLESGQPQPHGKKGTKRRKIESPFSSRVRTYQEQGGDDTALTATADRWESVARDVRARIAADGTERGKKPAVRKRGRGGTVGMPPESTDWVDDQVSFFCRVFGKAVATRLQDLIRRVRTHLDGGLGMEHRPPATQPTLGCEERPLEAWIESLHQQHQTRTDELNAVFRRYLSGARQYQMYEKALRDAETPGTDTYERMNSLGLTTSQGRGVATLVKAYYLHVTQGFDIKQAAAKEEDITDDALRGARDKLHNSIAVGKTSWTLQGSLSAGVFAVLPEQSPN